ncbi:MAG: hypothetical protein JWM41_868 [Gemmatimonadetes bacterium]|nr:hypothetical protein [Gemmatimonadota bacterium]
MSATQRFRKIKFDGDTVVLTWPTSHGADHIEHTLTSPGRPRDALPGSLAAFVPTVLSLLEFDDEYRSGLRVRGLSIKDGRDGDGRMLVLTCEKKLDESDAPLIFNTPVIKEADTGTIGRLLDQAEKEATEFLRGERFELSLLTEVEMAEREQAQAGMVFELSTGAPITNEVLRGSINGLGFSIMRGQISAWTKEERDSVIAWIGSCVAAQFGAAAIPDEPTVIADQTISIDRLNELLEAGPFVLQGSDDGWEVMHRETKVVDITLADKQDAEYYAGKLNRVYAQSSDITLDEIETWALAGPWMPHDDGDGRFWIASGTESETCESRAEAAARAARYNRTIGERGKASDATDDLWSDSAPPTIDDDAVQEIQAAKEAGVEAEG